MPFVVAQRTCFASQHAYNHRMKTHRYLLLAALCACTDVGETPLPATPTQRGAVEEPDAVLTCEEYAAGSHNVRQNYCASCHNAPAASGGFASVLDDEAIIESGKVRPGDPDNSPVYVRPRDGTMPPAGSPKPSEWEIDLIKQWILCLPSAQDDIDQGELIAYGLDFLVDLALDLQDLRLADARRNARYLLLGEEDERTLDYALNSLSSAGVVVKAWRSAGLQALRIDLRDYGWDAERWEHLVTGYPYAIDYTQIGADTERHNPLAIEAYRLLQAETGTAIPYVHSDWLLGQATRGQLYYDMLFGPGAVEKDIDILARLGVDVAANVAAGAVARAGFQLSGVSANNRVIERHEAFLTGGYLWVSYDYATSERDDNIWLDPVNLDNDASEAIFTLPNGLQGYYLVNGAGVLQANAPQAIVADELRPDHAVEVGLSCMGCHFADGIIAKTDEIRGYVEANFAFGQARDDALRLYPGQAALDNYFADDETRYTGARDITGAIVSDSRIGPVLASVLSYEAPVTADRAAATLGLTGSELLALMGAEPDAFPPETLVLRAPFGTVRREVWEEVYNDVVCAVGLGAQLGKDCGRDDGF